MYETNNLLAFHIFENEPGTYYDLTEPDQRHL